MTDVAVVIITLRDNGQCPYLPPSGQNDVMGRAAKYEGPSFAG